VKRKFLKKNLYHDVSLCLEIGKTPYMSDPLILAYDTVSDPVLGVTMTYN